MLGVSGVLVTVDTYGCSLGKKSERLVVRTRDGERKEQPFFDVEQVLISSNGVSISSDAIKECMERGIQIIFANRNGQPYGIISSPEMNGSIKTRREQLAAYNDRRGLQFVKASADAKLANQSNTLKYFLKSRKDDKELTAACVPLIRAIGQLRKQLADVAGECVDEARESIMTLEAQAGRNYWSGVGLLLPSDLSFSRREHQGTDNVVNMLLNYGYGILYSKVWSALVLAGLDPYGGFLHVDRPGKPSLVYDFVEEFRQPLVDRAVLAALLRGYRPNVEGDFLDLPSRRDVADRIRSRLENTDSYNRRNRKLQHIIVAQARHLAATLRGEGTYKGFVAKW